MHINIKVPQGVPCVSVLNNQKCHFLLFLYKIIEQEDETGPCWGGGRRWELVKKGEYGTSTIYTCVNGKISVETIPGIVPGRGG
jgi:hypothetical protein